MPKPAVIDEPRKITLYLPQSTITRGRAVAKAGSSSLSKLVTELLETKASDSQKVRVFADFPADEFAEIEKDAELAGQSVEDFVKSAVYRYLDTIED